VFLKIRRGRECAENHYAAGFVVPPIFVVETPGTDAPYQACAAPVHNTDTATTEKNVLTALIIVSPFY
jgi:hypothetical protein